MCNKEQGFYQTPSKLHPDYVTVGSGMRGYYAVYMVWTEACGTGFYEPWTTSETCRTWKQAEVYAKDWAKAENVRYQ